MQCVSGRVKDRGGEGRGRKRYDRLAQHRVRKKKDKLWVQQSCRVSSPLEIYHIHQGCQVYFIGIQCSKIWVLIKNGNGT